MMVLYKVFATLTICFAMINCQDKTTKRTSTLETSKNSYKDSFKIVGIEGGGAVTMQTTSLNLLSDNKASNPQHQKTFPRKGVSGMYDNTNSDDVNNTKLSPSDKSPNTSSKSAAHIHKKNNSDKTNVQTTTMKHVHKKPLVLNAEQLESQDSIKQSSIPSLSPSVQSSIHDQMPAPNQEKNMSFASRNPNMVIPLVITILVVPVFAIFGFMAVKKGQEAWKNRHYKRMDFLLDGMYND